MAAENEIQFFEAPFQYSIGEFSSNVNLTYHKLINTTPIKLPMMNTGFETPFSQVDGEKGDKSYFAIRKRLGFNKCKNVDTIIKEVLRDDEDINTEDYIITDQQIMDGMRFMMVCDINYTKEFIFYMDPGRYVNCQLQPQDACIGEWKYYRSYSTNECSYHKFQKITTLQATQEKKVDHLYMGNIIVDGGATTAVLFNESRTAIENLKTGDFIQIQSSVDGDVVVGQALQVGQFDAEHGRYNMGYGQWVGITDKNTEEVKNDRGEKIGDLWYMGECDGQIYDGIKLGISFAGGNCVYEWDGMGFVKLKQTQLVNANITSMTEDLDGLVYTTSKGVINFLRPHTDNGQSLGGTIYSTNSLYGSWDLAKSCGDYVFLFGETSLGIAYKNGTDERGDFRWNVQVLDRNMGYRNRDSVLVYNEGLYMIDNKKRFVKLDIEVTTDSYYRPIFKLQATDMSLHRINTDLRNLDKQRGDRVSLCKSQTRIYIIISDSYDINDGGEKMNTKILVYEDELKYRHRWYLCDTDVRYYHGGEWFGRGLWNYEGEKDNGKFFKEIISITFGDTSRFTRKELAWVKAAIGYHSRITHNTVFSWRADGGGFSKTMKMNTLHTSAYIKSINELNNSGKTDIDNLEMLYRNMPIGIGVYSGNGVGLIEDIYRTARTEFDSYCDYEDPVTYKKDTCCDAKPGSEPSGNGCTMKAPDADKQNFGSDRFQYHFNVAKFSTIPIDIGQQGQNFYLELVASNGDSIEFLGFMIGWMFMDNNFDAISNKPYYQTTPEDSLSGMTSK